MLISISCQLGMFLTLKAKYGWLGEIKISKEKKNAVTTSCH